MSQTAESLLIKQLEPLLSYLVADYRFDQKSVFLVFREDFFTEVEKQKIDFWVSTKQCKGYFKECKIQENTITFKI
jgi:hypothetical protein